MSNTISDFERLEGLLSEYDGSLKLSVGSGTAWAGELRLTLSDPVNQPSRSITFYSTGQPSPEGVADALITDVEAWFAETDSVPMPVPDWKGGDAK